MKKNLIILPLLLLMIIFVPACDLKNSDSIKTLTKPYIAQYECTSAIFDGKDILDNYDYIKIVLVDKSEMNVIYKLKGGDKQIAKGTYSVNPKTREFTADIGILGYNLRQATTIKDGKFTISKTIGTRQLIMNFENK